MATPDRRLAAILAGDVVGYSRLMAADEGATMAALRESRERIAALVAEAQGRLADFTGDAFLAEFPSAHDAVTCAVAIQSALSQRNAALPEERRMQFRLGMHLGDVTREGERIFGDGINVAARLQALAEPGGICVSGTLYEPVRHRAGVGFEDLGERTLKNLPAPVRVYRVRPDAAPGQVRRRRRWPLALASAALLVAVALWLSWPRPLGLVLDMTGVRANVTAPALPDKPSLVVLPFENMSGDPEQEYFSDGMTEDLITDLAKIPELFVIARHSAFTYKNKVVDVVDVGHELGVRYVLEGSVRKAGDRLRINAQLIDARSGFHLWSERYDGDLADVFDLQDAIAREILRAMQIELRDARMHQLLRGDAPDVRAHDLVLRAFNLIQSMRRTDLPSVRAFLEQAVAIDPDYAEAHAFLGLSYFIEYTVAWNLDPELLDRAEKHGIHAISIDEDVSPAQSLLAGVAMARGDNDEALRRARRAVELAPSADPPYLYLGMALATQGRPLAGLEAIANALRLNPAHPPQYKAIIGFLNYRVGRRDVAVALWEEARAANSDLIMARLGLAVAYEETGRHEEARAVAQEALRVNPDLTAAAFARSSPLLPAAETERLLHRAGIP